MKVINTFFVTEVERIFGKDESTIRKVYLTDSGYILETIDGRGVKRYSNMPKDKFNELTNYQYV